MGAIHFSIDLKLAELLAKRLGITTFVETGTFHGDSVALVRPLFTEIHSCELSADLHRAASLRFQDDPAIRCHLGSSPAILQSLAAAAGQPILYWLDAHWCSADHTAGEDSQCPLLEELAAIAPLDPHSVVWIDDARYFMAPPPEPLVSRGWPSFQQVLEHLQRLSPGHHQIIFANDTILFYPAEIEPEIRDYLKSHGADWLAIAHAARMFPEAVAGRDAFESALNQLQRVDS